jgi:hypothetical protein
VQIAHEGVGSVRVEASSFIAALTPGRRTIPVRPFAVEEVTMACSNRSASF